MVWTPRRQLRLVLPLEPWAPSVVHILGRLSVLGHVNFAVASSCSRMEDLQLHGCCRLRGCSLHDTAVVCCSAMAASSSIPLQQ
jgi:hypothetical protein